MYGISNALIGDSRGKMAAAKRLTVCVVIEAVSIVEWVTLPHRFLAVETIKEAAFVVTLLIAMAVVEQVGTHDTLQKAVEDFTPHLRHHHFKCFSDEMEATLTFVIAVQFSHG